MNCRDIEKLLNAERDGALSTEQRTTLDRHVATCSACAEVKTNLSRAMNLFQRETGAVAVPDVNEEWRELSAKLSKTSVAQPARRVLAPVIWFGAPLAAAAAIVFAFFHTSPSAKPLGEAVAVPVEVAQAEYVEPGNADASTIVYVDKDSGWLVVWATDNDAEAKK